MRDVVQAPARDHGAGRAPEIVEDLLVGARQALAWRAAAREHPIVQPFAAVAEPVGVAVVGPRDVAVKRHGHLNDHIGHGTSLPLQGGDVSAPNPVTYLDGIPDA
jgi:hypothetical protein